MADIITRLVVDSQDYDNKIKRASQGLQHYADACRKAGGTLEYVDEEAMAFARDLGKMDTAARSAKQQMREYSEAIAGLTATYRAMTDAEKSSDFGKTLASSIQQLKVRAAELQDVISDTNLEINNLASDTSFTQGLSLMTRTVGSCAAAITAWTGDSKEMEAVIKDLAKIGTTVAAVESLTQAFQKQNLVLMKNPYVLAAAGAVALAVAIGKVVSAMHKEDSVQKTLNEVQRQGMANAAQEVTRIEVLNNILHDNTRSLEDRQTALSEIQQLVPAYHGALSTEGNLINDNTSAMNDYVGSLQRAAIAQAAFDKMVELQRQKMAQQLELQEAQQRLATAQSMASATPSVVTGGAGSISGMAAAGLSNASNIAAAEAEVNKINRAIADADKQIAALQGLIQPNAIATTTKTTSAKTSGGKKSSTGKVAEVAPEGSIKAMREELSGLQEQWELATDDDSRTILKEQIDEVSAALDVMTGKAQKAAAAVTLVVPSGYSQEGINAMRSEIQQRMDSAQVGSSEYLIEADKLVDLNAFQNLFNFSMQNGLAIDPNTWQSVLGDIGLGLDVKDEAWESIVADINSHIDGLDIKPISLDVSTGNLKEVNTDTSEMTSNWKSAASAVAQLGGAMQQIEDPAAKVAGIIAQAIANVALGVGMMLSSPGATSEAWGWIALAATATATMISTITAIKSATAGTYAGGGIIPGNSFSGDNLTANVDAGELILNRAQESNIASQLEGSNPMNNLNIGFEVDGTKFLVLLNNVNRSRGGGRTFYSEVHR